MLTLIHWTLIFRFVGQVDRNTLSIVAPHLLGQGVDIMWVRATAQAYHVSVVEDAA